MLYSIKRHPGEAVVLDFPGLSKPIRIQAISRGTAAKLLIDCGPEVTVLPAEKADPDPEPILVEADPIPPHSPADRVAEIEARHDLGGEGGHGS